MTPYSNRSASYAETNTYTKGKPKKEEEEETVEYYDTEFDDQSIGTLSREEEEYLDFLETYGNVDFTQLNFLPNLKTVDELKD